METVYRAEVLGHVLEVRGRDGAWEATIPGLGARVGQRRCATLNQAQETAHEMLHSALNAPCRCDRKLVWKQIG